MATRLFQISSRPGEHVSFMQRAQQLALNNRKQELDMQQQQANMSYMNDLRSIQLEAEQYKLNKYKSDFQLANDKAKYASQAESLVGNFSERLQQINNMTQYQKEDGSMDFEAYNNNIAAYQRDIAPYVDVSPSLKSLSDNANGFYQKQSQIYVNSKNAENAIMRNNAVKDEENMRKWNNALQIAEGFKSIGRDDLAADYLVRSQSSIFGGANIKEGALMTKPEEEGGVLSDYDLTTPSGQAMAEQEIQSIIVNAVESAKSQRADKVPQVQIDAIAEYALKYENTTGKTIDLKRALSQVDTGGMKLFWIESGREKDLEEKIRESMERMTSTQQANAQAPSNEAKANEIRRMYNEGLMTEEQAREALNQLLKQQ